MKDGVPVVRLYFSSSLFCMTFLFRRFRANLYMVVGCSADSQTTNSTSAENRKWSRLDIAHAIAVRSVRTRDKFKATKKPTGSGTNDRFRFDWVGSTVETNADTGRHRVLYCSGPFEVKCVARIKCDYVIKKSRMHLCRFPSPRIRLNRWHIDRCIRHIIVHWCLRIKHQSCTISLVRVLLVTLYISRILFFLLIVSQQMFSELLAWFLFSDRSGASLLLLFIHLFHRSFFNMNLHMITFG